MIVFVSSFLRGYRHDAFTYYLSFDITARKIKLPV